MINRREQLRRILFEGSGQWPDPELTDAIVAFVAQWIEAHPELSVRPHVVAAAWREEMGA